MQAKPKDSGIPRTQFSGQCPWLYGAFDHRAASGLKDPLSKNRPPNACDRIELVLDRAGLPFELICKKPLYCCTGHTRAKTLDAIARCAYDANGRIGPLISIRKQRSFAMALRLFHSAAAGLVPLLLIAASAPAAQIKWVSSYPAAKRQAKNKNALMMLDFYTDW